MINKTVIAQTEDDAKGIVIRAFQKKTGMVIPFSDLNAKRVGVSGLNSYKWEVTIKTRVTEIKTMKELLQIPPVKMFKCKRCGQEKDQMQMSNWRTAEKEGRSPRYCKDCHNKMQTKTRSKTHPGVGHGFPKKSNELSLKDLVREIADDWTGMTEEFDNWTCMECHYRSQKRFNRCPKCGSQEVENLG